MSQGLRIALLGAGQLGGSFALALRRADPGLHITAYDPVGASTQSLVDIGGASVAASSAAEAVSEADLIIFAAPVRSFRALAASIAATVPAGAIVTDVGSVKASMLPIVSLLPSARVVPGHPIAGSEKAGVGVARADLFRGKLAILTPLENSDADAVAAVETLWHSVGADQSYDYVILSQALQAMTDPVAVLNQLVRIGKKAIVSVPNFGHWKNRLYLGMFGKMPVTKTLTYQWYDTPNIHFCTITDFVILAEKLSIAVEDRIVVDEHGGKTKFSGHGRFANLFGQQGVFLLSKR